MSIGFLRHKTIKTEDIKTQEGLPPLDLVRKISFTLSPPNAPQGAKNRGSKFSASIQYPAKARFVTSFLTGRALGRTEGKPDREHSERQGFVRNEVGTDRRVVRRRAARRRPVATLHRSPNAGNAQKCSLKAWY